MHVATQRKLTYEDFVRFPDDGRRHELINGVHYVTPAPATVHQRLVGLLHVALHEYLREHRIGEVFLSPFDVVLSEHDIVEPDLLVVLDDQAHCVTDLHLRGAPALAIEILSPGTRRRDEGIKRRLYERTGVKEYWLVDPAGKVVRRHERASSGVLGAVRPVTAEAGDVLVSPLLPGLRVDLGRLFTEASGRRSR